MRNFRIRYRIVLILWASILAFGLAAEMPRAEALDSSCLETCDEECGSAGCDQARTVGCDCYYFCLDGSSGSELCTL